MMTEAELDRVLSSAARRLRMQHALRSALAALGIGLACAAALIVLARYEAWPGSAVALGLALPPVVFFAAFLAIYFMHAPQLPAVALLLDRRAGTEEHLASWLEFRARKPLHDVQCGFVEAQKNATLLRAEGLNPRRLLPFAHPEWSGAVWLALLLLLCAILAPPRGISTAQLSTARDGDSHELHFSQGGAGAQQSPGSMPRVQIVSGAKLRELQLLATDPRVSAAQKSNALKELLAKIGTLPESALTGEVRDLLETLRSETAPAANKQNSGADGSASANGAEKIRAGGSAPAIKAELPEFTAKALSRIESDFPEIRSELERYYKSDPGAHP